jgi:hypothetical protein
VSKHVADAPRVTLVAGGVNYLLCILANAGYAFCSLFELCS